MEKHTLREQYRNSSVVIHSGEDLNRRRIEFSDDAKWIFMCCGSHVKVYSYSSRRVVYTLAHHTKEVTGVALHPKNRMQLLSSSLDGQLALWDYTDGALLRVIDLAIPLFRFGIRPGNHEPSLFFTIERDHMMIVGVSSHVITERQPAVAPSDQLTTAQEFLKLKKHPNEFTFSSKGAYLASYVSMKLMVYDLEAEKEYKHFSDYPITALTFHPSKLCIATGNEKGKIQLWYDFAKEGHKAVVTTFHWHAHSVLDLCFTTDGTHLLSGGEEAVLVIWQPETHSKDFRPRLGSPITKIACSPGDKYYCASLQSNAIHLLSGLDMDISYTLGGLRKAYTQNPGKTGMKTGLVLEPRSNSIVLNSTPGFIQFYQPKTDSVVHELDVTGLNYVSRPDDSPLTLTTVDCVAMAPDGLWLATVEGRDDGHTAPELRMKFWEFDTKQQCFTLNTCVEPPHDQKVTSLTFQPKQLQTSSSSQYSRQTVTSSFPYMAVSTSKDGRFKTWVVVDSEASGREEKRTKGGTHSSWACRSVGYYLDLPCYNAAFCEDGSLLALNFHKYVTVWDPYSCDLRVTFNCQFPREQFRRVAFGHGSSSQYLLAYTSHYLHTWDLLTCTVLWCLQVSVSHLIVDPFSSMAAAFVTTKETKRRHLYLFEPSNPTPLAVHGDVFEGNIIGSVFLPMEGDNAGSGSKLYFMDRNQVLYAVRDKTDLSQTTAQDDQKDLSSVRTEQAAQRSFYEIFGNMTPGEKTAANPTSTASQPSTKSRKFSRQVLSAPPHVLPPMSTLCQSFLSALLPASRHTGDSSILTGEEDNLSDYGDTGGHSSSESETEDRHRAGPSESQLEPTLSSVGVETAMEVDGELRTTALGAVGNYDWLTEHFGQNIH